MIDAIEIMMGTGRKVLLVPGFAIKLARPDYEWPRKGVEDNLREARYWLEAKPAMKKILCPVLFVSATGDLLVMPRTSPISPGEWESARRHLEDKYSEAYTGPEDSIGFEIKIDTCGLLNGKPVVIDYGD
jgi:hypothetical protein